MFGGRDSDVMRYKKSGGKNGKTWIEGDIGEENLGKALLIRSSR